MANTLEIGLAPGGFAAEVADAPTVSVLMAVYARENPTYLRQALASLFAQTYLPLEIVVVEDGPLTEALDAELEDARRRSPVPLRTLMLPENRGLGEALREGVLACRGTYVARMDADDVALPHRFADQMAYLHAHPDVALLGAWIEEFHDQPGDTGQVRRVPADEADIRRFARLRNPFNHMTVVFRREEALRVGNYLPFYLLEDYYLWYRFLKAGLPTGNLPEALVYARVGNGMVGRRRGYQYLRSELRFIGMMRREGFIGWGTFGLSVTIKFLARILPTGLLQWVYARLRNDEHRYRD